MFLRLTRLAALVATSWSLAASACGGSADHTGTGADTPGSEASPSNTTTAPGGSGTPPADVIPAELDAATRLYREGRFEDAATAYTRAAESLQDTNAKASAHLGAAVAWEEAGAREQSMASLRAAVDAAQPGTQAWRRSRYLLGLRMLDGDEAKAALATIEPPYRERYDDPLQPRIDVLYARSAAADGKPAEAAAAWDAAFQSPLAPRSLRTDIAVQRATAAQALGDAQTARHWLAESVRLAESSGERFAIATLALKAGDRSTFAVQLETIVAQDAGSSYALLAAELLEAEGFAVDPGDAGYVAYRHRRYSVARELLSRALAEPGLSAADRAWRTYYLAASYEDAGFAEEAIPLYDAAAALDPLSTLSHRARYWAARSVERTGAGNDASARYAALVATGPPGPFSSEAAFRAGFVLLATGDSAGAIAAWRTATVHRDSRLLYWTGRAQLGIGDSAAATVSLEGASKDPLGFYGMEASRELGKPPDDFPDYHEFQAGAPANWDAIATWLNGGATIAAPPAANTAAPDLLALGLNREAAAALHESEAPLLARMRSAVDLGMPHVAAQLATSLLQERAGDIRDAPTDLVRIAYPLAYVALLDEQGRSQGVDPLFLAALIRTESFWDPRAVSVAAAVGLTQVIPSTGEAIARALTYNAWTVDDLERPSVSIAFGAYYVGGQLDRFGNAYQALAAYNGGPANALVWGAVSSPAHPADFLEAITFGETRSYVETVMTTYAVYRYLYRA